MVAHYYSDTIWKARRLPELYTISQEPKCAGVGVGVGGGEMGTQMGNMRRDRTAQQITPTYMHSSRLSYDSHQILCSTYFTAIFI